MTYPVPTAATDPNDLSLPLRGATIKQAFLRFWKKYVTFSGRASQSEFWWWYLISVVVSLVFSLVNQVVLGGFVPTVVPRTQADFGPYFREVLGYTARASVASSTWALATLVGQLAITVRRLHDTNRSGWWYLIVLIPVVGPIILIVFCILAPDPAGQRFDR